MKNIREIKWIKYNHPIKDAYIIFEDNSVWILKGYIRHLNWREFADFDTFEDHKGIVDYLLSKGVVHQEGNIKHGVFNIEFIEKTE